MTAEAQDNLETQLAELTRWKGGATALWRRALGAQKSAGWSGKLRWNWFTAWRPSKLALASIALGAVFVVAVIVNIPGLFTLGSNNWRSFSRQPRNRATKPSLRRIGHGFAIGTSSEPSRLLPGDRSLDSAKSNVAVWESLRGSTPLQLIAPSTMGPFPQQTPAPFGRQVIRTANIDLRSEDVRAAFLKIQHLVRPADGEYVKDSALTGTGQDAQANLTLRVASDRLSDVLNELRQIAEVVSESKNGQDVTAQVVDIEGRLRNEKRVEEEILELLQSRKNAALKDILDMREKLGQIRREIERLTGERERLDKLVSLATVLVIIRAKDAPQSRQGSLSAYFGASIDAAWRGSLLFLADTLATMLRILVGGAVFWVILAGGVWAIARHRRWATREGESG